MNRIRLALLAASFASLAGCSPSTASSDARQQTTSPPPSAPSVASTTPTSTIAATPPASTARTSKGPLTGVWTRTRDCRVFVQAMQAAGLAAVTDQWLVEAGHFASTDEIDPADPCRGAATVEQSHFFTDDGEFGSTDATGRQVDAGNYRVFAGITTVVFPSHSLAFGYRIVIHYDVAGDEASFTVEIPDPCPEHCVAATAWALSAFYPGSFRHVVNR
jgi:hypothetical protein